MNYQHGPGGMVPSSYNNGTTVYHPAYNMGMPMEPQGVPQPGMVPMSDQPETNSEYQHQTSVLAEQSGVSTAIFDSMEELVWIGTNAVSSCICDRSSPPMDMITMLRVLARAVLLSSTYDAANQSLFGLISSLRKLCSEEIA